MFFLKSAKVIFFVRFNLGICRGGEVVAVSGFYIFYAMFACQFSWRDCVCEWTRRVSFLFFFCLVFGCEFWTVDFNQHMAKPSAWLPPACHAWRLQYNSTYTIAVWEGLWALRINGRSAFLFRLMQPTKLNIKTTSGLDQGFRFSTNFNRICFSVRLFRHFDGTSGRSG